VWQEGNWTVYLLICHMSYEHLRSCVKLILFTIFQYVGIDEDMRVSQIREGRIDVFVVVIAKHRGDVTGQTFLERLPEWGLTPSHRSSFPIPSTALPNQPREVHPLFISFVNDCDLP
jgi:hypothetical protein